MEGDCLAREQADKVAREPRPIGTLPHARRGSVDLADRAEETLGRNELG